MDKRSTIWIDANGYLTITAIPTLTGATGIQAAIIAGSHADYWEWWESATTFNPAPNPTTGAYQGGNQRAVFIFSCGAAGNVSLIVPAPDLNMFMADGETVDPATSQASAIITACIGNLCNSAGVACTTFVSGALVPSARLPLT